MIWAVFPMAWAVAAWALLNNFKNGRGNVPPSWWWTTLPFGLFGGMTAGLTESAAAGIAVGLLAAVVVHLPASARHRRMNMRPEEIPSYLGRSGVLLEPITSLDFGRINLEGLVLLEDNRKVYAITTGKAQKVAIPKGARVRIIGSAHGGRPIVEPAGNFTEGYRLN